LASVARFAEENAKAAVADKARDELRTHLLQNLRSLAESDSPVIGKALSTLAEKAPKELRGPLHLALAQNLRTQYEQAHQKKDKDADKLLARTEAVLKQVTKDYPEMNKRAQDLQFELDKLTVGRTAMDIEAEDLDGKKFKLSDYRGKVVVLDFGGIWCPPGVPMSPRERSVEKGLENPPFGLMGEKSEKAREKLKKVREDEKTPGRWFGRGGSRKAPIPNPWRGGGGP